MGFGVALSYVSDVYKTVHKDNSEAQASEVGLGFNLGGSYYIYRDFGADVLDSEDDYFYMTLPGAGSNRLVKISGHFDDDGDYFAEYKTEEDSYARIIQISDAYGDVPSKFIVTTVDGTKYYFNHPRSTVVTLVDEIPSTDYIVSDEDMNWMDARAWCNVRGRSLACIGNSDDDLEAENKLGDNRVGWIGQYDSDGDGCWDDGCGTQSYQNWEPGHPEVECNDPYGNGNIYVIKDGDDGYWKDVNNPSSSYFAVCDRTIGGREAGTEKEYIYQWDLNLIEDVNGNKIYFSYHDESFEFKDKGYTKSYLDSISDSAGNSINIVWGTNLREDIFYGDIIDGEISPNTVKDHFVTDVITSSSAGGGISDWHFEYDYVNDNLHGNDSVNKKLVLTSLTRKGGDQTLPPFVFNYTDENDNPGIGYLERITYPAGAKVELGYEEKIIRGLITFVGDPGWEETSEDWGDRDTGDYYCDNFIWSPVECVNHGCKWEYNDCFMDQDTITGYRVNRKSIDDGLGNIEEITYSYENALLHLEKKRQKYIGHDSVTINYPEGFGYTIKNFCNDGGSTCASGAGCDEIASAKLDGYMYESRTYDDRGAVVASSDLRICPTITYLPPDDEPLGVIENPDFQEWTDEVPDGWTKVKSNSPSCSGYSLDEFILEDVQYGYVKMRTPRYLPECFYLKQDIDVEAGV